MKCRKTLDDVKTGATRQHREQVGGSTADCPTGIRHEGGVTWRPGFIEERGNLSPRCQGRNASGGNRKRERTDAGHRGGVTRSRVEGSVMGLDRRGGVVRLYYVSNPQGEDLRG